MRILKTTRDMFELEINNGENFRGTSRKKFYTKGETGQDNETDSIFQTLFSPAYTIQPSLHGREQ